jgi:glutamine amidotransferase
VTASGAPTGTVAIVDYGSGNLHSVDKAVAAASRRLDRPVACVVTADAEVVATADRIILPGVGAFADCRAGLDAVPGMVQALDHAVRTSGRPFLGICVGAQLLATRGIEFTDDGGGTSGLDWIRGDVVRIEPGDQSLKIPHMGWNTLDVARPHPILAGIPTGPDGLHAYFVHSFHLAAANPDTLIATTDYGMAVTAIVADGTFVGVQFHPEKSQALGLALLENFLRWRP